MTEAGPLDLLSEDEGEDSDGGTRIKLPGVTKGGWETSRLYRGDPLKCGHASICT